MLENYQLVENNCKQAQKTNSKKPDILFSYHETNFHSCQKCIKKLLYCNKMIHSKVEAEKYDDICSREKKCTKDNFFVKY